MASFNLTYSDDREILPQHAFPFEEKSAILGLERNGETIRKFSLDEFKDAYLVLYFFPMDFTVDSVEVLAFNEKLDQFSENHTQVVGVTQDSPYVTKQWTKKPAADGGFGKAVGFPILSDKDQHLAQLLGVATESGLPCRSVFIVDWKGNIRYMMASKSKLGRSVDEILRLARAYRHSDLTGEITPASWIPGGEVIPTDFSEKIKYYRNKFGKSAAEYPETEETSSIYVQKTPKVSKKSTKDVKPDKENPKRKEKTGAKGRKSGTKKKVPDAEDSTKSSKKVEKEQVKTPASQEIEN